MLEGALGERPDGKWSAFEVGLIVSRQNGKGSVLEARELAGLFLFGEQLILHSAHEFKTASEAFRRVLSLVENTDHLRKKVAKIRTSHGDEGIELRSGARLRFVARSRGSGRGFTGDCIILDEAYNLSPEGMAALLPTLSARPNPQLWYASSAGMDSSEQLRAVRDRGRAGGTSLAYFEWSAPEGSDPDDWRAWAQANPALGIRVSAEFVSRERDAMPAEEFARERLGIWDDPDVMSRVIPEPVWAARVDPESHIVSRPSFAIDVSPLRDWSCIAAAGRSTAGGVQVEVTWDGETMDHRPGTDWVVGRMSQIGDRLGIRKVTIQANQAAAALIPDLEAAGFEVEQLNGTETAAACGAFHDLATSGRLTHLGQADLDAALACAKRLDRDGTWTWGRKKSGDITPIVAATLASAAFAATQSMDYDVLDSFF